MSTIGVLSSLYKENKYVKLATNLTAIITAFTLIGSLGVNAAEAIDNYFAKVADIRALQNSQVQIQTEQQTQRLLLERQSKQLDFIYYDSMKRERTAIEKELFDLRRKTNRTGDEQARLEQLQDDLTDIKARILQHESLIRGNRTE